MKPYYEAAGVVLYLGDCIEVMRGLPDASVDAIVTDPPYELTSGKKGGTGAASVNLDSPYGRARIGTGNGSGGFMGKAWDATGIAHSVEMWSEALRVLKPGGHLAAFGGTRTYHRMACAIEDAGFEVRDSLMWLYGSGFPKSLDVSKAIDKAAGAEREIVGVAVYGEGHIQNSGESIGYGGSDPAADTRTLTAPATDAARQWEGWGTALKPAYEPIVLARKPLIGTVAQNVLTHGTGAINVDGCRIGTSGGTAAEPTKNASVSAYGDGLNGGGHIDIGAGRWPANVLLDEEAASLLDAQTGDLSSGGYPAERSANDVYGAVSGGNDGPRRMDAGGGASRFFYTAKASRSEREAGVEVEAARRADAESRDEDAPGSNNPRLRVNERRNDHPTVKPVDLMRWLCRLVTPPGGLVLDPFNGSGTTGMAALDEGFRYIGIDLERRYLEIAQHRITHRHLLEVETKPSTPERPQGVLL